MLHDLRYSFRLLLKNPGFSVVAVLSLALGIAATTTIFSVVYAGLLRALPYHQPDRLVRIRALHSLRADEAPATTSDVLDWRAGNHVFEGIEMFLPGSQPVTISAPGLPERVRFQYVTKEFFSLLGTQPVVGRVFSGDDHERGIVISYAYWQRRFHGDREALGQKVTINGNLSAIIGVMPRNFHLGEGDADIWRPVSFEDANFLSRQIRWLDAVARLKPGVSIEQARAEMKTIAGRLEAEYPDSNKGWSVTIQPLHEALWGFLRVDLYPLLAAVGFILLIACANVASLMLARSQGRAREMAVRAALGARRWRLARQLLCDGVVLSIIGGAIGILMAAWGVAAFLALAPSWFPLREQIRLDATVLVFSTSITIATGILTALAPAFGASKPDLNDTLKSGVRGALSRNFGLTAMVVAEVGLTLILMIGGGLMIRTFVALRNLPIGLDPANVLTAQVEVSGSTYVRPAPKRGQQDMRTIQPGAHEYYQKLIEGVEKIPGVESAGLMSWLPMDNEGMVTRRFFRIAGVARPAAEQWAFYSAVSPEAFRTLRIPLRAGRYLTERDTEDAPWAAVVNEAFVRHFLADQNPIGRTLTLNTVEEERPREIVGVVADVIQRSRLAQAPEIYVDFHQQPMMYPGSATTPRLHMAMVVRSAAGAAVTPQIRTLAADLDRTHPVFGVKTMNEVIYNSTDIARFYTAQLVGFAGMALLLASVGIYGVMSYAVGRRRHEIGVRMALGASQGGVMRDVLGQGMRLALMGLAIGLAGSFGLMRFIASYLFGVKPIDAGTFIIASVVLVMVAMGAVYRPARRATEVDPMVVLRCE